jgi:23S rRNA (uracil1939-C5)-methyltransferase
MRHMKHPSLFSMFQRLREAWVGLGTGTGEMLLSLFGRVQDRAALRLALHTLQAKVPGLRGVALAEGDSRHGARMVDHVGSDAISEQVGDVRLRVGATAFFQVSGLAASRLTSLVLDGARLTGTERVLELYSGVGTFTVPLAWKAREVVGVEGNPVAAADGEANLRDNGCAGARILGAPVEHAVARLASGGPWDLVVLDPPRQGCSRAVLDHVMATRSARVIYVSCDPSTLARDLGVLVRGGYRCTRLTPIDLFPQTFHLESVAVLER